MKQLQLVSYSTNYTGYDELKALLDACSFANVGVELSIFTNHPNFPGFIEELEQQLATMRKKYDRDIEELREEHRKDIEYYEQEDARKRVVYEQAVKERNAAYATVEAIRNLL